jgi:hypothetical protein
MTELEFKNLAYRGLSDEEDTDGGVADDTDDEDDDDMDEDDEDLIDDDEVETGAEE